MLTDQNKAYTIRLCQGPGILVVETGIANLMQDLLVAGGTQLLTDEVLHSKLLGLVVGGIDVYGIYKDYAQEEQIMNMITMLVMSAPPAGPVPGQYPNPQGYPQYQPYPQNPRQRQFLSLRSNSPLSSFKPNKSSTSVGAVAPQ